MVEITDRESLREWLEGRPIEDARLIAARAALRSLPLLATALTEDHNERRTAIILPSFRAMAVASFAGTWPKQATEVQAATAAAAFAATTATAATAATATADATAAATAATTAADAAAATAAADAAFAATAAAAFAAADAAFAATAATVWKAVERDVNALDKGMAPLTLSHTPLWPDEKMPKEIDGHWQGLRSHLLNGAKDEGWKPWVDWYEGILEGFPGYEDLELAKALIPDETWKAGPKAVNDAIRECENRFFKRGLGPDEGLALDPDDAEIKLSSRAAEDPKRYDDAVNQLANLIERLLAKSLDNQFQAMREPMEWFLEDVAEQRKNPSAMQQSVADLMLHVRDLVRRDVIPASAETDRLMRVAERSILDIISSDPATRETVAARRDLAWNDPPEDAKAAIRTISANAQEITDETLGSDFAADERVLTAETGVSEERAKLHAQRLASRTLEVREIADQPESKIADRLNDGVDKMDKIAKVHKGGEAISAAWTLLRDWVWTWFV